VVAALGLANHAFAEEFVILTTKGGEHITQVAFSPDGGTLAASDFSGKVVLWDLATLKEKTTLKHSRSVRSVSFSPNGKSLAAGSLVMLPPNAATPYEKPVSATFIWDVATQKEIARFEGDSFTHTASSVAFSPDGKLLAVGSCTPSLSRGENKGLVTLWDVSKKQVKARYEMRLGPAHSLAFSPDSKILAASDADFGDGEVKLWDVATGKTKVELKDFRESIHSLAFSPDGKRLVTGGWIYPLYWRSNSSVERLSGIVASRKTRIHPGWSWSSSSLAVRLRISGKCSRASSQIV
jgi:WD40 repeat protein